MGVEFIYKQQVDSSFKKEGNGYWICCGSLNCFNNNDEYYVYDESIKELFLSTKSRFGTLLKEGLLAGEAQHPDMSEFKGKKDEDYLCNARFLRIEPTRTSHTITGIRFVDDDAYDVDSKGGRGNAKRVNIYCLIEPVDSDLGRNLRSRLESGANVAFSIRTYSRDIFNKATGRLEVVLTNPITFDWVDRGGIHVAAKDNSARARRGENDLVLPMLSEGMRSESDLDKVKLPETEDTRVENHNAVLEAIEHRKATKESPLSIEANSFFNL